MSSKNSIIRRYNNAPYCHLMRRHFSNSLELLEILIMFFVTIKHELVLDTVIIVKSDNTPNIFAWYDLERPCFVLWVDNPCRLFFKVNRKLIISLFNLLLKLLLIDELLRFLFVCLLVSAFEVSLKLLLILPLQFL